LADSKEFLWQLLEQLVVFPLSVTAGRSKEKEFSMMPSVEQLAQRQVIATLAPTQLSVGSNVRVRFGVLDPDYPDLFITGWTGTIVRTNDNRRTPCLVRWDWNTLEHADPTGQLRRKQDGLVLEEMWLAEEDLSVDPSSNC
jgi:hypothetical protein